MEDAHLMHQLDPEKGSWLFGVFDGHGGPEVAQFCAAEFVRVLKATEGGRPPAGCVL
jgi:serine/threonine protein phosphatase PrpC